MLRFSIPVLAALAVSHGAEAMTVNVDFTEGHNIFVGRVPASSYETTGGTWRENGVDIDWRLRALHPEDIGESDLTGELAHFSDFAFLADQSPGTDPVGRDMTVSRIDGGTFDLKRIGAASYTGATARGFFLPEGAGSFEDGDVIELVLPLLNPSLWLTGRKADGSVVTGTGVTKTAALYDDGSDPYSGSNFGQTDVMFTAATLAKFSDLVSLNLSLDYPTTEESLRLAGIKSLIDFEAPAVFLEAIDKCGFRDCSVEGLGDFIFYADLMGSLNYNETMGITDFDIEFTGAHHPAPVPLPASAFLLLGGLAALCASRLTRRARV